MQSQLKIPVSVCLSVCMSLFENWNAVSKNQGKRKIKKNVSSKEEYCIVKLHEEEQNWKIYAANIMLCDSHSS